MGFNKRFVSIETIKTAFENNQPLGKLFDSDAVIFMDDFSSDVYKMLNNGISETEVKKTIYGRITSN